MGKNVRLGNPKRAIAYLRVSTTRQELSPHAQATAIQAWADASGVEIVGMFFDKGVSGSAPVEKRPALLAALGALRTMDAGSVVVAKRDRLARDVMIAATIELLAAESGAAVVSAAGEGNGNLPADRFMRQVLDAVAELERATIRARTAAALAAKKLRPQGPPKPRKPYTLTKPRHCPAVAPYGFRLDLGRLVPDAVEQAALEAARRHQAAGLSMAAIAAALTSDGMFNRKGHAFGRENVWRMLQQETALAA